MPTEQPTTKPERLSDRLRQPRSEADQRVYDHLMSRRTPISPAPEEK